MVSRRQSAHINTCWVLIVMSAQTRPLRPGDTFRVSRGFPRRRVDEDAIDFLRVHYETDSPGLGHVVEVRDDGFVFELWGHRFITTASAAAVRPLNRLQRLFATQCLGEAILRSEVTAGQVTMTTWPMARQPLMRWWLRKARAPLPALEALGGRIHPPPLRWAKARLYFWLGRLGVMPPLTGYLDHGPLLDRIGTTITFPYTGQERQLWLDRVILHKNHSIHLVGIDLDKDEQRTFRLDRIDGPITIPDLGEVERDDLYWQLEALCMSRAGWIWYWNRYQERHGRPLAPPIGLVGKLLSLSAKPIVFLWNSPRTLQRALLATQETKQAFCLANRRLRSNIQWHIREFLAARRPVPRGPTRPPATWGEPVWRGRLQRAVATIEAGGREQVTCLLPMGVLLADGPTCRAFLRHLLELTLTEARTAADGHPQAPELLAQALAISPPTRQTIPERERRAAQALLQRLEELQPGTKRVWVHATRRAGRDGRLLLAESYLAALYHLWPNREPQGDVGAGAAPAPWWFYRTTCYFVARWQDRRFRMGSSSAKRLRTILDWFSPP